MNCKYVKLLLSHFVDNDLETKRRKRLESHLQECSFCKNEVEKILKTIQIFQKIEEVEPPRDYRDIFELFHYNKNYLDRYKN